MKVETDSMKNFLTCFPSLGSGRRIGVQLLFLEQ